MKWNEIIFERKKTQQLLNNNRRRIEEQKTIILICSMRFVCVRERVVSLAHDAHLIRCLGLGLMMWSCSFFLSCAPLSLIWHFFLPTITVSRKDIVFRFKLTDVESVEKVLMNGTLGSILIPASFYFESPNLRSNPLIYSQSRKVRFLSAIHLFRLDLLSIQNYSGLCCDVTTLKLRHALCEVEQAINEAKRGEKEKQIISIQYFGFIFDQMGKHTIGVCVYMCAMNAQNAKLCLANARITTQLMMKWRNKKRNNHYNNDFEESLSLFLALF